MVVPSRRNALLCRQRCLRRAGRNRWPDGGRGGSGKTAAGSDESASEHVELGVAMCTLVIDERELLRRSRKKKSEKEREREPRIRYYFLRPRSDGI